MSTESRTDKAVYYLLQTLNVLVGLAIMYLIWAML